MVAEERRWRKEKRRAEPVAARRRWEKEDEVSSSQVSSRGCVGRIRRGPTTSL
jgi:hypothetical protein